jgi:20S proteasome subunit beta 6
MQSDMIALHKLLKAKIELYEHDTNKQMSVSSIAQMLSNILYYKRFFPYYTFNLVGGIEKDKAVVYGYDAIGSYQEIGCGVSGSGEGLNFLFFILFFYLINNKKIGLSQALLDNQYFFKNQLLVPEKPLNLEQTLTLLKDSFNSTCERDIYTGDGVEIAIITKDGIKFENMELKKD